jgi:hypothetical protein
MEKWELMLKLTQGKPSQNPRLSNDAYPYAGAIFTRESPTGRKHLSSEEEDEEIKRMLEQSRQQREDQEKAYEQSQQAMEETIEKTRKSIELHEELFPQSRDNSFLNGQMTLPNMGPVPWTPESAPKTTEQRIEESRKLCKETEALLQATNAHSQAEIDITLRKSREVTEALKTVRKGTLKVKF